MDAGAWTVVVTGVTILQPRPAGVCVLGAQSSNSPFGVCLAALGGTQHSIDCPAHLAFSRDQQHVGFGGFLTR